MPMLGGTLALHDVNDVEKLARKALDDALRNMRARLKPLDQEDALAYLVAVAWEQSRTYDSNRGSFSRFAYRTMRLRLVDWYRQRYWDTRSPKPDLPLSLDAHTADTDGDADDPGTARLVDTLRARPCDPGSDCDPGLQRLLARNAGKTARLFDQDDRENARRAAA